MLKPLVLLFSFTMVNATHALEIDEKLTLRFLKVSTSKKTVLINRGAEDGLAVGDHAKFFRTTGVVARGVVEKISPSRSIWSIYRIIDSAEINDGIVMNLKIASPVKVSVDPSKSMKDEDEVAGSEQMDLNDASAEEGAALPAISNESEKNELDDLEAQDEKPTKKEHVVKNRKKSNIRAKELSVEDVAEAYYPTLRDWEVWGTFYINSLSGTQESSVSSSGSTATVSSTIDFSAGLEHYFLKGNEFFKESSLMGFIHKRTIETGQDFKLTSDWLEYGIGFKYHFYNPSSSVGRPVVYVSLNGGIGNATLKASEGSTGTEISIKGTNTFFSGGLGVKYLLRSGFGARAIVDYYSSSETYAYPSNVTVKRTLAGPRVQMGISYRF